MQGTATGPRAALFFSLTLLGIKSKQDFNAGMKVSYKNTLMRMAPGACMQPLLRRGCGTRLAGDACM